MRPASLNERLPRRQAAGLPPDGIALRDGACLFFKSTARTPPVKFRPDIEGLRAVAVMLVVAAHARIDFLAGGFIGVDVFFVLSGYLITGLLVQELTTHGRIDLPRFYARRFRRLFPSLLVVIAISSLLGQQLLAIGEQPGQALAAASAIVWLSNFYFSFSELDYFSAGAEGNLFLHTWSLGVEEQFYLIWPALLILLATAGRPD
ncbi:MAG TPA: acyltransferase, partial [Plasticicumulans sp.]|nr:acyltransferase [Plasticicumulans sp.]